MTPGEWFERCVLKQCSSDYAKGVNVGHPGKCRQAVLDRLQRAIPKESDPLKRRFLEQAVQSGSFGLIDYSRSFGRRVKN